MKVIDLLNKIANGKEVPEKVRYKYKDYVYKDNYEDYYCEEKIEYLFETIIHDENWKLSYAMNIKVEIIEDTPKEKKKLPEKLEYVVSDENGEFSINGFTFDYEQKMQIIDTLNQVIDYLKSKGDE